MDTTHQWDLICVIKWRLRFRCLSLLRSRGCTWIWLQRLPGVRLTANARAYFPPLRNVNYIYCFIFQQLYVHCFLEKKKKRITRQIHMVPEGISEWVQFRANLRSPEQTEHVKGGRFLQAGSRRLESYCDSYLWVALTVQRVVHVYRPVTDGLEMVRSTLEVLFFFL